MSSALFLSPIRAKWVVIVFFVMAVALSPLAARAVTLCYEDVVVSNAQFVPANATYRFVDFFQYKPTYRRIYDDGTFYPPYENIRWGGNRWIIMVGGTNRYEASIDTPTPPPVEGCDGCPNPWLRVTYGATGPITITVRGGDPFTTLEGPDTTRLTSGEAFKYAPRIPEGCGGPGLYTYSVVNQPLWASFDATTGELTGTPTALDVGTYGGIQITATDSDGNEVSTQVFAIDVEEDEPAEMSPPSCPEGSARAQEPDYTLDTANAMGSIPGSLCMEGKIYGSVDHFTFFAASECSVTITSPTTED